MNFDALIQYISTTPLVWLLLTLGSFKLGIIIYEKSGKNTLLQPIIIAYCIIMSSLLMSGVSYEKYFKSVEIIHFFLGPATVALALPLYNNLKHIKNLFFPILITLVVAGVFSIVLAVALLWAFRCPTTYDIINDNKVYNRSNRYHNIRADRSHTFFGRWFCNYYGNYRCTVRE